jgi:hypothetical protein
VKIKQLSVFLENKPGQLELPIKALAAAGISISTLCLADTQAFGILRLIAADNEGAKAALGAAGLVVNECEVLAIEVPDHPGGLESILAALEGSGVNVEYMYAFSYFSAKKALLIFRFDDPDRAAAALTGKGMNVVAKADLFGRNGK